MQGCLQIMGEALQTGQLTRWIHRQNMLGNFKRCMDYDGYAPFFDDCKDWAMVENP